jgi:hypothetical protein
MQGASTAGVNTVLMIEYITTNSAALLAILAGVYALATAIANITPTDTDNKVLAAIAGFAGRVGLKLK